MVRQYGIVFDVANGRLTHVHFIGKDGEIIEHLETVAEYLSAVIDAEHRRTDRLNEVKDEVHADISND